MKRTQDGILREVRAKISKPERWTTGAVARNADGERTGATNKTATRWCLNGALCAVSKDEDEDRKAYNTLMLVIGGANSMGLFNDMHTHAQVLDVLDRAIELAESWL